MGVWCSGVLIGGLAFYGLRFGVEDVRVTYTYTHEFSAV